MLCYLILGLDSEIESNNLEVYLFFIRKKLKAIDSKVNIKSLINIGYKLKYSNECFKEKSIYFNI